MNTDSVISDRGQLTVPKELRDRFGLKPGTVVTFVPSREGLVIQKAGSEAHAIREVFGVLKDGVRTDDYLLELRGKVE